MLIFIDESGDAGLNLDKGSSKYFVIILVIFEDNEEAIACDKRVNLLKRELGLPENYEFKFHRTRKDQRIKFLEAVLPYQFFYFGIVINKSKIYGRGFKIKESFYKYTCNLVFQNAKPYLEKSVFVFDGCGSRQFKKQLKTYLRKKLWGGLIKKIKIQNSRNNTLIQLADMIAGSIYRSFTQKDDAVIYREIIKTREFYVQFWPK